MEVFAMVLALGLAVLFFCTGCSRQEQGGQGGTAEIQEFHADTVPSAMASAAIKSTEPKMGTAGAKPQVQPVNERTRKPLDERFTEMLDPVLRKRIQNGDQHSRVSIKRSSQGEKDAYELARASANGERNAAGDR